MGVILVDGVVACRIRVGEGVMANAMARRASFLKFGFLLFWLLFHQTSLVVGTYQISDIIIFWALSHGAAALNSAAFTGLTVQFKSYTQLNKPRSSTLLIFFSAHLPCVVRFNTTDCRLTTTSSSE
jgi:hypothetical protein